MENFDNPYAKLFYAVYRLHHQKVISDSEKLKLKALIALGDQAVVSILNKYTEDQDADSLFQDIVKLIRPSRHKPEAIIPTKSQSEDISSPLGTFLHEKKKRQMAEHELKLSLQNSEIHSIIETHDEEIHLITTN
jgi:hypothetical protein